MNLIFLALAPVFIIAFYIYFRDKYEREPAGTLIKALITGAFVTLPVIFIEGLLIPFSDSLGNLASAAYNAFLVAGFTEEAFKYLAFFLLIWRNRTFNEKFDGIVYAVFISLGFAAVENVFYVLEYGYTIGLVRALTAVPAHALFGIVMGYHFGLAKFYPREKGIQLLLALLSPVLLHGFYDFCLMAEKTIFLLLFVPFIMFLWIHGFRRMKNLSDRSIFKPIRTQEEKEEIEQ
ncbi:MAG: PrsW family intramembrane metalloprotease [Bacteroidales bacterium]|nr:MAG: PrsW family intramembrane metalloprotease [Bacteroidales bacterium]